MAASDLRKRDRVSNGMRNGKEEEEEEEKKWTQFRKICQGNAVLT